jgi:hypothetical protein
VSCHDAKSRYFHALTLIPRKVLDEMFPAKVEPTQDMLFQGESPQIHTPEFRRWFKDSKVVDESGEPLRVYHGSKNLGFNVFKHEVLGKRDGETVRKALWFTDDPNYPKRVGIVPPSGEVPLYVSVRPFFLSVKNPLDMRELGEEAPSKVIKAFYERHGLDIEPGADWSHGGKSIYDEARKGENVKKLEAAGFDGYIIKEEDGATSYLAFRPEQVKSATDNRGTFDPDSPNILYQPDHTAASRRQRAYKALLRAKQPDLFDEMGRVKPKSEKQSLLLKARRAVILSGIPTLAKLTAAAGWRIVGTPVEEIAGGGLSAIAPKLSSKAPREGQTSMRAEMAALKSAFSRDTLKEVWGKLRTGESSRDKLYGHRDEATDETTGTAWLDFFGRVHGALKVPAERAEFYRSLEKRGAHAARNGVDLNDPAAQLSIGTQAYADSKRAILMQDNLATNVYKEGIRFLRQKGGMAGKAAATVGQVVFPIVKVPTNYVREAAQYIPGVGTAEGLGKIIAAKGIRNLKAEDADAVMRAFKKQGVGLGLVAIGFFNPQAFGGYYTKGDRDEKDLKAGEMKIFGVKIPHLLAHSPALEAIQFGATVRRVLDSQKSADKEQDAVEATYQAGKGLAEQAPFIDSYLNAGRTFDNTKSVSRAAGEFTKGAVIPPDVQRAAKYLDTDSEGKPVPRYPQGGRLQRFYQSIETGVPGLRRNVPDVKKEDSGGGRTTVSRPSNSRKGTGRSVGARPNNR